MQQVREVMSRNVQVISPDHTIQEAACQMRDGDFGMMPVGENDRMIGAISDRDITIHAVASGKGPGTPVREVMKRPIVWIYEDDTIEMAASKMSEHQIRRLPVVNHDKRLVGIVSLGDLALGATKAAPVTQALNAISR